MNIKNKATKILSWFDENQNKAIIISEIIRHISSIEDLSMTMKY